MKPILFNGDMVRAILDGRKTVTRMPIRPQPRIPVDEFDVEKGDLFFWQGKVCRAKEPRSARKYTGELDAAPAAPYKEGDILYVRETWAKAKGGLGEERRYFYRATDSDDGAMKGRSWHPSIHMPKGAARIFLRVTDVSVERLQKITEEEVFAEGVGHILDDVSCEHMNYDYHQGFRIYWDSLIKKADLEKYGYDANPWVWVVRFERKGDGNGRAKD